MTQSTQTTSTGWTVDYEWGGPKADRKVYRVWVYTSERHPIEGKRFGSYNEARRVALEMGLTAEGQIQM